jgi:glycosyltransferase involved in cell wall biosynthesis
MSPAPRLSVGLPVYNGERYLPGSIEALLGQTYTDFELIISDNASTDGTPEICESYAKQDSRIRYIRQPRNIGLSPNHNFVVREARGEMFKWAAADDLYGRDLLRCCVEALDEHPGVVLAHSYTAAIDADGTVTHALDYPLATASPHAPERLRSFLFGSSGLFETNGPQGRRLIRVNNDGILRACDEYGVIRTSVLRKIAPLGSYHHSDRIVVVELILRGPFHITPDWLYFRRDHPDRTYNVSPSLRTRCEILDPVRKDKLRHPTARLVAEYFWGYLAAIQRAPISAADKRECYRDLVQWMLDRAVNKVSPRGFEQSVEDLPVMPADRNVSVDAVVAGQQARLPR